MSMNESQSPTMRLVQRAEERAAPGPTAGPPVEGENPFSDVRAASDFHATIVAAQAAWQPDFRPEAVQAQEPRNLRLVEGDRVLAEVAIDAMRADARARILELGSPEIRARLPISVRSEAEHESIAFNDVRALALGRIAELKTGGGDKALAA